MTSVTIPRRRHLTWRDGGSPGGGGRWTRRQRRREKPAAAAPSPTAEGPRRHRRLLRGPTERPRARRRRRRTRATLPPTRWRPSGVSSRRPTRSLWTASASCRWSCTRKSAGGRARGSRQSCGSRGSGTCQSSARRPESTRSTSSGTWTACSDTQTRAAAPVCERGSNGTHSSTMSSGEPVGERAPTPEPRHIHRSKRPPHSRSRAPGDL